MIKHTRKILTALALLSNSAFAAATIADHSVYVSGNVGMFQGTINSVYNDLTDVIAENIAETSAQNGYTAGAAIGLTKLIKDQYMVGVELSGNVDSSQARFKSGAATAAFNDTTKVKNHVDLVFIPGMILVDTWITYLKLGVSLAQIRNELNSPTGFAPTYMNYNTTQSAWGFVAGVGLKKYLTQRTAIFTEYTIHDYQTLDLSNFMNFSATYSHNIHATTNTLTFGLAYNL